MSSYLRFRIPFFISTVGAYQQFAVTRAYSVKRAASVYDCFESQQQIKSNIPFERSKALLKRSQHIESSTLC